MSEQRGVPPFEPGLGAAVRDAKERIDELDARPRDEVAWSGVGLREYWNGARSALVFKPSGLAVREVTVRDGRGEEMGWRGGRGALAVLLSPGQNSVTVEFEAEDKLGSVTVSVDWETLEG